VEWAKAEPDDILWRVTVKNNGPDAAPITVLLQTWFRNTWSWNPGTPKPNLRMSARDVMRADHPALGTMQLACDTFDRTLFCENETNTQRCFGTPNPAGLHPKDTFNDFVVHGTLASLPAMQEGTKGAFMLARTVAPGATVTMRARLRPAKATGDAFADFDKLFATRIREADAFYDTIKRPNNTPEQTAVQRRAYAGLLWNYQWYQYDVHRWIDGDPGQMPPPASRADGRNHRWHHMDAEAVLSMPDKWVRALGSGVPVGHHRHHRFGSRQAADLATGAAVDAAPRGTDPRVRMGAERRESTHARVGRLSRVPDRALSTRSRGP